MKKLAWIFAATLAALPALAQEAKKDDKKAESAAYEAPKDSNSEGKVTVKGKSITYSAVAGTILVQDKDKDQLDPGTDPKEAAKTSMFYVAYFKKDSDAKTRPLVFLYNGGPGSASLWLHMGSFGPKRIVTENDTHTPPAPYKLVENESSLLDVADLVFIDAPGTGFSRIMGKDKEKAFLGMDGDARAFTKFVVEFLTKHKRWNSPKYLFGESYGTPRSAVVARMLQEQDVELNGIILLSQILNFATSIDGVEVDPGNDLPYVLALPTFAAVAWYHKALPEQPAALDAFVREAEQFALKDYAQALLAGSNLAAEQRKSIIERLHHYTGLSTAYLDKANLRVDGGEFEAALQNERGITTGRLDARFAGPSIDLLSQRPDYDPFSASVGAAFVASFNDYVRSTLRYQETESFRSGMPFYKTWDFRHKAPGSDFAGVTNVLPDLALTMKTNPLLKVLSLGGYYDLATPYFAGKYELDHLPIPQALRANIDIIDYPTGHMIYVHEASRVKLHEDIAAFITKTSTR